MYMIFYVIIRVRTHSNGGGGSNTLEQSTERVRVSADRLSFSHACLAAQCPVPKKSGTFQKMQVAQVDSETLVTPRMEIQTLTPVAKPAKSARFFQRPGILHRAVPEPSIRQKYKARGAAPPFETPS